MSNTIEILDIIKRKDAKYCEGLLQSMSPYINEILLSHVGLEELCSFAKFKCVEALWLNDNVLSEITGLDTNVQIKALYLHNNRLSTLEPKKRNAAGRGCKGALSFLNHIQTLSLYNNCLQDLQANLRNIRHLSHLEELGVNHFLFP
jgi:Leucine-rich repeat (LRR) protein